MPPPVALTKSQVVILNFIRISIVQQGDVRNCRLLGDDYVVNTSSEETEALFV